MEIPSTLPAPDVSTLNRLPEEVLQLVLNAGTLREYQAGERIMSPGDRGEKIRFVVSGSASVVLREHGQREIQVERLGPGDPFGVVSYFTGRPSPPHWGLVANGPCTIIEVDADRFGDVVRENSDVASELIKNLARKVIHLDRSLFDAKRKKRALQAVISREGHVFPEFVFGGYMRRRVLPRIEELANSEGPILIMGETGVGREVLAHFIFKISSYFKEVFLLVDVQRLLSAGPLPEVEILEPLNDDELRAQQCDIFFGHEELDNQGQRSFLPGYLELTDGGTLLLRGAEYLSPEIQDQILHAIEEGLFPRPGGELVGSAKIRLIVTSKLDPVDVTPDEHPLIDALMDRAIIIPPLRKRLKELPELAEKYLAQRCQQLNKPILKLPQETLKTLLSHTWPGNDLELSNTIKRAVLLCEEDEIKPRDIYFDLKRVEGKTKLNLLKFRPVRSMFLSPLFPAVLQSAVTPFFFILMALLLLGPVDPLRNPASLFSWALGWPALVAGAFIWARFWCSICPMGTLAKLSKKVISLEKPFPTFLKNRGEMLVAAGVLFIIWLETATNMRASPFNLALLLLTITLLAVFVSVVYERQSWCRYLCPLGSMTGVLAKASLVELRADRKVCASQCSTHECYFGNEDREGCPFGQVAPTLHSNLLCKVCGTCIKNCPHHAVDFNLRIPGQELWEMRQMNVWSAFLAVSMIAALLSELLIKSGAYSHLTSIMPMPELVRFTALFTVSVLGLNFLLLIASAISGSVSGETVQQNYAAFGIALLPLTLTVFLAYHIYYLINLGVQLPILVSQNFNLAIFQHLILKVPDQVTWTAQKLLIWAGVAWSLFVMYRLGTSNNEGLPKALGGILPHAALALVLGVALLKAMKAHFYG